MCYYIFYLILYSPLLLIYPPFLSNLSLLLFFPSSSSIPFQSSYTLLLPTQPFFSSSSFPFFCSSVLSFPSSHPLIHSILVGTYIYLFIFPSFPNHSLPSPLPHLLLSNPLLIYSFPIYPLPPLIPILPNIHSILVGTYIYLFIFLPFQ